MTRYRLAVDIGGTFTDLVVYDKQQHEFYTHKTLSTPHNLAEGVMAAIDTYIGDFSEIEYFVHGTTSGLNAFLERKGAKVALLVTEGFRDVYEIGRANRTEMYNIQFEKSKLLLNRADIYEVKERVNYNGEVEKEIDLDNVDNVLESLKEENYDAVAVCFLHSYKNPEHEQKIKRRMEREINIPVSLSSDIAREWREYERVSTTIINAYVAPIVKRYLEILEGEMKNREYEKDIYIMQSNGGVMTSKIAKNLPLQTLMSGPVGGTIGGMNLADITEDRNLICVDMGGTSFDVSMIIDGEPDITAETIMEGFPILSPMVNIHTVGAGGGSIAYLEGGGLRVGPKSAGSYPGPACYGNGGTMPTVTDANLVLGRIDPHNFLGGDIVLDKEASKLAVKTLADKVGLTVEEMAEGICDIANAKMADTIRNLTVKKGIDPREFTIVAFGGAGPMHASFIAELLGVKKVLVPNSCGTFSAWGMLRTDIRYDTVRNFVSALKDVNKERMTLLFDDMRNEAEQVLEQQNISPQKINFQKSVDIRYFGQEYTVNIPYQSESLEELEEKFHQSHFDIYGHNNPLGATEIVNVRTTALGDLEKMELTASKTNKKVSVTSNQTRSIVWKGIHKETNVFTTDGLNVGAYFDGPAVIEDKNSTIVIPESYSVQLDDNKNIVIYK